MQTEGSSQRSRRTHTSRSQLALVYSHTCMSKAGQPLLSTAFPFKMDACLQREVPCQFRASLISTHKDISSVLYAEECSLA